MLLILILPLAATLICFWAPQRACGLVTAVTGVACLGLVAALVPAAAHRDLSYLGFLRVDALSRRVPAGHRLPVRGGRGLLGRLPGRTAARSPGYARYSRRFWTGLNIFAWSMLAAPLMSNLALLWVAIEVTTVISALLVAIEDTDGAAEAAWKYVLIASAGLGLALLATIFAYYAGAQVLGQSYDLAFSPLLHAAGRLPHTPVQLAFVLAVLGYGTKMGLFPVHTWLPDAHSEAPTPVSALLSGSLLAVSFYAILRFYQVAAAALGPRFPRDVLLVFGVASLLLAALYLFGQRDIKRMLAYSSVEHMGILAIGVSFGAPDRAGRRAAARAGARGGQGQRVHGRRGAGAQVRHQADRRDPRRPGRAAVERAAVPAGDPRAGCDAAVRHVPQRVRDRGGRLRVGQHVDRGDPHHRRDRWRSSAWPRPPTGLLLDARRRRSSRGDAARGASRAPGWWSPSPPARWRCWCSACTRPAELTELLGRAVHQLAGAGR